MIFTKSDRAAIELTNAKLDAITAHLAGCTLVSLSSGLDKLMQSHAALEKDNIQVVQNLTALTNGSNIMARKIGEMIQTWNQLVAVKPKRAKRPAKSRKK